MKATYSALALFLGAAGCNDKCSGVYHCPAGIVSITLPADISAQITSASGDTCSAQVTGSGDIYLSSSTHKACHVAIQLDDGTSRTGTVTFQPVDDCCGDYTATATPFEPVDGGAAD